MIACTYCRTGKVTAAETKRGYKRCRHCREVYRTWMKTKVGLRNRRSKRRAWKQTEAGKACLKRHHKRWLKTEAGRASRKRARLRWLQKKQKAKNDAQLKTVASKPSK